MRRLPHLPSAALAPVAALLLATLLSCGGDDPVDPAGSAVASVAVTPSSASLEVGETTILTAAAHDADGATLSGRTIRWSSQSPAVAGVNGSGVVTALAPGSATIIATSEGQSGQATITITQPFQGVTIGPDGGAFELDGGAVRIDVPAGAVPSGAAFGAAVSTRPLADPAGSWLVGGAAYTLYPEGATFARPVTVTLRYDPDQLPAWVDPATLGFTRWDGTAWHPLQDVVVDVARQTVTGTTTSFSDVSAEVELPEIVLSPDQGHVNDVQRDVVFVADVDDISTEFWHNFTYEWTSTRQSGSIFHTEGNSGHYLATKPLLTPNEELDEVTVTMMAERVFADQEDPVLEPIGSATVTVRADLDHAIDLVPTHGEAEFGDDQEFRLVIRDRNGNQLQDELEGLHFTWTESGFHGSLDVALDERTRTNPAIYRAKGIDQQEFPAPRVDQIGVLVEQRYRVFAGTAFNPNQFEFRFREVGTADAFVRVRVPNPMSATFVNGFVASGSGGCVTAYYQVRKIPGATSYSIMATDFGDAVDPFGGTLERSWTGATSDVLDHGDHWRVRLEAGCAQNQFAVDARRTIYQQRYGNARVEVTVTEPD